MSNRKSKRKRARERRKQLNALQKQRLKVKKQARKATKDLPQDEHNFYVRNPCVRNRLVELEAIQVFALPFDLEVFDAPPPTGEWSYKHLPKIWVSPFVRYVYKHLEHKHRGQVVEAEFWEIIEAWASDRALEDNIIGVLELEKESFVDWTKPDPNKFWMPSTRAVKHTPMKVNVLSVEPMPLPSHGLLDLLNFSFGLDKKHVVQCTHDEVTVECPNGTKTSACPVCELQRKTRTEGGRDSVQERVRADLPVSSERGGADDMASDQDGSSLGEGRSCASVQDEN